jgi:hypothetical protein
MRSHRDVCKFAACGSVNRGRGRASARSAFVTSTPAFLAAAPRGMMAAYFLDDEETAA